MRNRGSRVRFTSRAVYGVTGWVCGMAVALLFYFTWKADVMDFVILPLSTMLLALWYGESTGRIPTREEASRPISLFSKDSSQHRS